MRDDLGVINRREHGADYAGAAEDRDERPDTHDARADEHNSRHVGRHG